MFTSYRYAEVWNKLQLSPISVYETNWFQEIAFLEGMFCTQQIAKRSLLIRVKTNSFIFCG